ncbi:MAG: response regulator [Lachnospiraceae bacterium]|nr:response regulator [Candidatus Colinaster equi]
MENKQSSLSTIPKLLVVDDTEVNIRLFKFRLKDYDLDITTCNSGEEALRLTATTHYHIIFLDHMMPEMDGIDTLYAIRNQQNGLNIHTPVIAMTAAFGEDALKEYLSIGFDNAVFKPYTFENLTNILKNYDLI